MGRGQRNPGLFLAHANVTVQVMTDKPIHGQKQCGERPRQIIAGRQLQLILVADVIKIEITRQRQAAGDH